MNEVQLYGDIDKLEFVGDKPMILSLQGCMAVGKTTAVRYIQENAPYIHISYEINTDVVDEVKRRNLDKNKFEDYIEIQKLWLNKEIFRWNKAIKENVDILMVDGLDKEQVGLKVKEWCDKCIADFS